jgi:signal recognition particle GTPase
LDQSHNNSNTCAINDHLNYLENENEIMKDQVEELMNSSSQTIKLFEGGKYKDNVREVYLALLSMNVGVKNVEKIVQTVLEKMASIKVDRLPKKLCS